MNRDQKLTPEVVLGRSLAMASKVKEKAGASMGAGRLRMGSAVSMNEYMKLHTHAHTHNVSKQATKLALRRTLYATLCALLVEAIRHALHFVVPLPERGLVKVGSDIWRQRQHRHLMDHTTRPSLSTVVIQTPCSDEAVLT